MKRRQEQIFGLNISFCEQRLCFLQKAGEVQNSAENQEAFKKQQAKILTELGIQNENARALEEVKKAAYNHEGVMLNTVGLIAGGATGNVLLGGAAAEIGSTLTGKSVRMNSSFKYNLDHMEKGRLSLLGRGVAEFQTKIGYVGEKSIQLLAQLRGRLDKIEGSLSEAKNTLERMKSQKAQLDELREVKFFDLKPGAFIAEKMRQVGDSAREVADKHLRISAKKDAWGIGRLEKSIAVLEDLRDKTKEKIGTIEGSSTRMAEMIQKPDKAATFIAEQLGRSKNNVLILMNDYLNNSDNEEIVDIVEAAHLQDPYLKKEIIGLLKQMKKLKLGRLVQMSARNAEREEAQANSQINTKKASEMFAMFISGKYQEGDTLRMTWNRDVIKGLINMPAKLVIKSIAGRKMIAESGGQEFEFDLQNGSIKFQYFGQETVLPLRAVQTHNKDIAAKAKKASTAETGKKPVQAEKKPATETAKKPAQVEEKPATEAKKEEKKPETEIPKSATAADDYEQSPTAEQSSAAEEAKEIKKITEVFVNEDEPFIKTMDLVATLNGMNYGETYETDQITGTVVEVQSKTNTDTNLVFFKTDQGELLCDIVRDAEAPSKDEAWLKPAGVKFSFEEITKEAA